MQKKQQGNLNTIIRIGLMILVLLLLIYVSLALIGNRNNLTLENVMEDLLHPSFFSGKATEFRFTYGKNGVYGDLNGGFAVASSNGIQAFDKNGSEIFLKTTMLDAPVVETCKDYGVAYDVGGNELCVFNGSMLMYEKETEDAIISATVNRNGWVGLCTEDSSYLGLVTVYDANGEAVFQWYSGSGYLMRAMVSPDNREIAMMTLTEQGSRLVFFRLNEEEPCGEYLCETVILQLKFVGNSTWMAVSEQEIMIGKTDGTVASSYDLEGKFISNICMGNGEEDYVAVFYSAYQVTAATSVVVVDKHGNVLGQQELEGEMTQASMAGDYIGVLYDGKLAVYFRDLTPYAIFDNMQDVDTFLMNRRGTVLVVQNGVGTVKKAGRNERV